MPPPTSVGVMIDKACCILSILVYHLSLISMHFSMPFRERWGHWPVYTMRGTVFLAICIVILNSKSIVFGKDSQQTLEETENRRYQICNGCVPKELVHAPGIGLDLSSSYGYVSSKILDSEADN